MRARRNATEDFVSTQFSQDVASRSLDYIRAGFPVHLVGPAGVGKTTLALYIAEQLSRPITILYGHHEMRNADLLGRTHGLSENLVEDNFVHSVYKRHRSLEEKWVDGPLKIAVQQGHTLIYDEFTRSHTETNNILLSVLEERVLPLYGAKDEAFSTHVHPDFSMIFTSNPLEYAGVYNSPDALLDRMITIRLDHLDTSSEAEILAQRTGLSMEEAHSIASLVAKVRTDYFSKSTHGPGLRTGIKIAKIVQMARLSVSPTDERFHALCCDVLGSQLFQVNTHWGLQDVGKIVSDEIHSLFGG